jgi:choline-sulfatase
MTKGRGISRRRFIKGIGAAAGTYGLTRAGGTKAAQAAPGPVPPPLEPRAPLSGPPNFLVIMVDEERFPPVYESKETRAFRRNHLVAHERLKDRGMEFTNHHIMSAACSPSRASLFTGQYPSLHGVSQTDGFAKSAVELDHYWLDPDTVPTMGDYFRAAGYDTYYKGKWHVSHSDIPIPGTHTGLPSYEQDGTPDPQDEQEYLDADRLDGFGFAGWIGPDPHGKNPLNSGSSAAAEVPGRDAGYARQGADLLAQLRDGAQDRPWLVVTSFVNPHDIAVWGELTLAQPDAYNLLGQLEGSAVPEHLFEGSQYDKTSQEDLAAHGKPSCQQSYVDRWASFAQPTENDLDYRRFYYQMHQNADREVVRSWTRWATRGAASTGAPS